MITPEQMLEEALNHLDSLSIDELETLFLSVGLITVRKNTFHRINNLNYSNISQTQKLLSASSFNGDNCLDLDIAA